MNALVNSMQKTTLQAGRRCASVAARAAVPRAPGVPEMYQYSFKKAYLSDPSIYPLIGVLGAAAFFIVGMSANALTNYKHIRISPSKKHQVIRNWGEKHVDSVTKRLSNRPVAMHAQGFKDIRQEGLGINHDEWKKGKEAYSRGE